MPSPSQPLTLPPEISPHIRDFFEALLVMARDYRTSQLVDYLCDLYHEMQWVTDELAALDFDAVEFLEGFAANDDDDDDDGEGDDDLDPEVLH